MQNPIKRYATLFVLAIASVSVVPAAAMADRTVKKTVEKTVETTVTKKNVKSQKASGQNAKGQNAQQKSAKNQPAKRTVSNGNRQRKAVGHRFQQKEVVVIKDWSARGLRRPNNGEVYISNGDSVYLAAAASLIVKALIN